MRSSKKIDNSVKEALNNYTKFNFVATTWVGLRPGDLIIFNYTAPLKVTKNTTLGRRVGLVVKSRKSHNLGYRLSSKLNTLLNIYLIDNLSPAMIDLVINNLYQNRGRATYNNTPKVLDAFLNKKNFRTLNCKWVQSIIELHIDKSSKIQTQEGEE